VASVVVVGVGVVGVEHPQLFLPSDPLHPLAVHQPASRRSSGPRPSMPAPLLLPP
jgi:hypothetical protein